MRAECQFAKAGQGLFYNGFLVDKDGHTFSFVYDCGTSGVAHFLENSVDEYKSFVKNRLDILFISHLHRDHISHIPKLIENMELNQVVLPNLLPEIRLLLASRMDGIETNHELIALYVDPVKYFVERGANQVTILNSANENDESLFRLEDDVNYRNDYPKNNSSDDEIKNRNRIVIYSRSNRINDTVFFNAHIEERKGVAYFFMPHYSWEFRAINLHYQRYDDSFLEEVREFIENNGNDFNKLLRNSKQVKRLKTIYDDHFKGKLNDTSVIVRSYPIHRGYIPWHDGALAFRQMDEKEFFSEYYYEHGHAETLLLGDITMDGKALDHLLYRHLDNIKYPQRIIQLTHHGARMRCHLKCCDFCRHIGRNGLYSEFVASYGLINSYGHPDLLQHRKCRDWCFDRYASLRLVNERKDFSYTVLYEE